MNGQRVCPFYGRGRECCEVGTGYISPFQVEIIVRHCASRYEDCARYRALRGCQLSAEGEPAIPSLVALLNTP